MLLLPILLILICNIHLSKDFVSSWRYQLKDWEWPFKGANASYQSVPNQLEVPRGKREKSQPTTKH